MLTGFVIMPEHSHLLVFPRAPESRVSDLLSALKRPHSYQVKTWMLEHQDPWLGRLTVRERPDKAVLAFLAGRVGLRPESGFPGDDPDQPGIHSRQPDPSWLMSEA
jgi:hypothetical protein